MPKQFDPKISVERETFIEHVSIGINDGILSISALLAFFIGFGQRPTTIFTIVVAAMLVGALSLAAGQYLGAKTQKEDFIQEAHDARMEINLIPELKKEELHLIYQDKGFKGDFLEEIVEHIVSDKEWFTRELALDEMALNETLEVNSAKNAFYVFLAFLFGAIFPTISYIFAKVFDSEGTYSYGGVFVWAFILTMVGLLIAGSLKTYVTNIPWIKSAIEMLVIGLILFLLSWLLGLAFSVLS